MGRDAGVLQRLQQGGVDADSVTIGEDHLWFFPEVSMLDFNAPLISSSNVHRGNKMEAIRNKYRGVKFMKVADLPELKGEVSVVDSFKLAYFFLQVLARLVAKKR